MRVRVQACAVCHSDALTKEGIFPGILYPRVPGHEIAGVIDPVLAKKLGADLYIDGAAADAVAQLQRLGGARVILAAAPSAKGMSALAGGLGANGTLLVVGVSMDPLEIPPLALISGKKRIQGWASGIPTDSEDTLRFAEMPGVRPMIERYPLEKAAEGYARMMSGKAEFRVVLTM